MHLHAATESAPSTGPLPWVLREGITNIVRHAQARNCWIAITPDNGGVRLTIEDDGAGVSAGSDGSPRGGLNGLQRRVSADGGVMETPPRRHGFTLTAWVPSKAGGAAR